MARALRWRTLAIVAGILVAAGAAAGAIALRASGEDDPVIPVSSSYTEGIAGTWQRINPLFASGNPVDQDLVALLFNGLVRVTGDGSVEPDLAEALPQVSPDGRVYTFTLRPDLRWHDGEPLTSRDVVFTIERIVAPDFAGDPNLTATWAEIDVAAPDPRTVTMTLPQSSAPFLARHATVPIIPRHLLNGLSSRQLFESTYNSAPVGTGPYRLTSLASDGATLERYNDYHLGRPAIQRLRLRFFASEQQALEALERRDVDGVFLRNPAGAPPGTPLDEIDGVHHFEPGRGAYHVLYLNNAQAQLFQDSRVRQAISLAIDRAALVESAYGGFAIASSSPVAPGSWAYAPEYEQDGARLEDAAALLDEAGWVRDAATGIRVNAGSEFRFTIRTDDDPVRSAVAAAIASQLEPLGIRATAVSTTFSVLRRDSLQTRRYEAALVSWDQGPDPDPYFGWHSSQLGAAGLNIANFANSVADLLIEDGRTQNDPAIRLDAYRQLQEVWSSTAPSAIIAYPQYRYLVDDDVEAEVPGVLVTPAGRFANIHLWRS